MGPIPTGIPAKAAAAGGSIFGPLGSIAGGLLGPIVGGLFGRSGQDSANEANYRIARENREWQERMSNTAYQRAAADLNKAGLNRILAIGRPASTPAGNVATMLNKNKQLAEGISTGVNTALQARKLNQEIKESEARIANIDADTTLKGVTGSKYGSEINLNDQKAQTELKRQANITSHTENLRLEADIKKLNMYGIRAESDLWKWLEDAAPTEIRKLIPMAGKYLGPLLRNVITLKFAPATRTSNPRFNMELSQ
jgi:hypothetical protein